MAFVKVLVNSLLLLSAVQASNASPPNIQIYTCSNLRNRPGVRQTLILNDNAEARHHIIPFSILRSFFQEAWNVAYGDTPEGMFRLRQFIQRYIRNLIENYDVMAREAYSSNYPNIDRSSLFRNFRIDTIVPTTDFTNTLHTVFTWMPGNIFFGPSPNVRSDDPGDRFEENSRYIVGDEYYRKIKHIYDLISSFIVNEDGARTVSRWNEILTEFQEIDDHSPFEYDSDQWEYDERTQKYHIKTNEDRTERPYTHRELRQADVALIPHIPLIQQEPYCFVPEIEQMIRESSRNPVDGN